MKVWVDNELIDDGDMNYIGSRLVHRYDTEEDRDAAIPSPGVGQIAYVSSVGWTGYSGGTWRELHHIPNGGTTGQVLAKASDDPFDVEWVTP